MKANPNSQIEKISPTPQLSEAQEGGLNLGEIKDIIFRQLHVIAGITAILTSLALFKALSRVPNYQAGFEILSDPVTVETKVTSTGSQERETREAITAVKLDEVQLKALKSPKLILSVVNQLQDKYRDLNYTSIISTLDLQTNTDQNLLQVTYKHPDPQQVKDVLETLAQTYLDYSLQKRQSGINRGLEFLDQQIPQLQAQVDQLHQQLQQLREKHDFIEPVIQGQQLSQRLEGLIQQEIANQAQLEKTQWLAGEVNKELEAPTTSTTPIQVGTSRYNKLLEQLGEVNTQIAQKSTVFSDENPAMQNLREKRQELVALLNQEGETVKKKLERDIGQFNQQERAAKRAVEKLRKEIKEWSGVTRDYEDIDRRITITARQLNELLIQREALRLESSQKEAPWSLLTVVGEPQTDASSMVNSVIVGSALGLLLGLGVAFTLDKYQNLIYNTAGFQQMTTLPILGVIPFDSSLKKFSLSRNIKALIQSTLFEKQEDESEELEESGLQLYRKLVSSHPISPLTETFRFVGANLGLFDADNSIRSLVITSAIPGEGKSTIAINLAKTTAALGRRVLVIDTDMRSVKKLNGTTGATATLGLSNLFLDQNLNLDDVIEQSSLQDNLFILPAGSASTIIDDPSQLLASSKMRNLMEELKTRFELVIYDAPPIMEFADVSLLAPKTDGVLLVAGLGKLQTTKFKETLEKLSLSKMHIFGILINQVTAK
jgi:capsular exopolysaccharide synthesis family protein